jgi:hypothetical protein
MTNINNTTRTTNMLENCGMKGMHEGHAKKVETSSAQQTVQVEAARDEAIGNKLDVRV